jgi:hypothetical protein
MKFIPIKAIVSGNKAIYYVRIYEKHMLKTVKNVGSTEHN